MFNPIKAVAADTCIAQPLIIIGEITIGKVERKPGHI
jgi:hypothetical protein